MPLIWAKLEATDNMYKKKWALLARLFSLQNHPMISICQVRRLGGLMKLGKFASPFFAPAFQGTVMEELLRHLTILLLFNLRDNVNI